MYLRTWTILPLLLAAVYFATGAPLPSQSAPYTENGLHRSVSIRIIDPMNTDMPTKHERSAVLPPSPAAMIGKPPSSDDVK